MALKFTITQGKVSIEAKSPEEVIEKIKEFNLDMEQATITKCVCKDVSELISNMMRDDSEQEQLRNETRKKNKLKQFDSAFMDNDWELPYEFDLMFDLKSEGHIAYLLKADGFLEDKLLDMCLSFGITEKYLKNLNITL